MRSRNLWITIAVLAVIIIGGMTFRAQKSPSNSSTSSVTTSTTAAFSPTYQCTAGGTALAALQAKYPVDTKDSSLGKQIMGINNVMPTDHQFWSFNIDGQAATVGADAYQCQGTESISWKLESF